MKLQNVIRFLIVAVPILLYEIAARQHWIDTFTFIPFTEMVASAVTLLSESEFVKEHLLTTLLEMGLCFVISVIGGIAIGFLLWRKEWLYYSIQPYLLLIYAVPLFALYPIFITFLGLGPQSIISMAVLLAITAVISNTTIGLLETKKVYEKVGQSLNMPLKKMLVYIYFPAAWPQIFTGLKLAVSYSIIGVLASEFILSTEGLGYTIARAYNDFENNRMFGAILLVIAFSLTITLTLAILDNLVYKKEVKGK